MNLSFSRRRRAAALAAFAAVSASFVAAGGGITVARAQMSAARKQGVSFSTPTGYRELNPADLPPAARTAVVTLAGPITNRFATNINLVVQPSGGATTLPAQLPQQIVAGLSARLPGYKSLGNARIKVAGADALRLDAAFQQPPANTPIRNRQVYALHGGRVYVFTFSSSAASFARDVPAFDRLLKTVRWTTAK